MGGSWPCHIRSGGRPVEKISFIGLGAMGSAMVDVFLKSGHTVTVWNRTEAKCAPSVAAGAVQAGSVAEALRASPVTFVCIKNHQETEALLAPEGDALAGRIVIDLSTGGADEAVSLTNMLEAHGARWQIGMINAYPSGIGKDVTSIFTVGPEEVWDATGDLVRTLAGASRRVGDSPNMLAALFAAMFTTRQGYMCGMLYGAAVAKAAGVPPEVFAQTLPVSEQMSAGYSETFRRTVPSGSYDNPGASMKVYSLAFDDAQATVRATGAPSEMADFMADLVRRGCEAGYGDKELTALYEMLTEGL